MFIREVQIGIPTIDDYVNMPPHPARMEGGILVHGTTAKNIKSNNQLVSFITVVRNGEKYLEQTILSVLGQTYDNIEYIIIDGASTDGTLDIIRKYEDRIDYWMSEPDNGIYDAINKGVAITKGAVIKIINSSDWLEKEATKSVIRHFFDTPSDLIVMGNVSFIDYRDRIIDIYHPDIKNKLFPVFSHPSWFVSKSTYTSLGLYVTNYKISSDYEFYRRAVYHSVPMLSPNLLLANFRKGGVSSGFEGIFEGYKIDQIYLGTTYALIRLVRLLFQKSRFFIIKRIFGSKRAYNFYYSLKQITKG